MCGVNSVCGVFHGDRSPRRNPKAIKSQLVDIWSGLGVGNLVASRKNFELIKDVRPPQMVDQPLPG